MSITDHLKIDARRRLQIQVVSILAEKYNGVCPVKIEVERSPVMAGHVVKCIVPGQERSVYVSEKDAANPLKAEDIAEQVLYAVFLLMDEDEDD